MEAFPTLMDPFAPQQASFKSLPPNLLQLICFELSDLRSILALTALSQQHKRTLRDSPMGKIQFLRMLLRDLDLSHLLKRIDPARYDEVKNQLIELFRRSKFGFNSRVLHFFGFTSTQGVDRFPNNVYGCHNAFVPQM